MMIVRELIVLEGRFGDEWMEWVCGLSIMLEINYGLWHGCILAWHQMAYNDDTCFDDLLLQMNCDLCECRPLDVVNMDPRGDALLALPWDFKAWWMGEMVIPISPK